nr:immunoglobulin heavy chain junction region [Mus musculus]
CARAGYALDYW